MLERFIYEDHKGRRFDGLEHRVFLNSNDLRDYTWSYDAINSRITRFYMGVTKRSLPLVVVGRSDEEAIYAKHRLFELAESDIDALKPGKIYIGEYYTTGYITASKKSNYLANKHVTNIALTLVSDNPMWYSERKYGFVPEGDSSLISNSGADYKYDYPYDYAVQMNGRAITCDTGRKSAFKLLIYGPATNPAITITGHEYAIDGTLNAGETLLIDSLQKTITLTTADGRQINWFDRRKRDSYIFEPIPDGKNVVSWIGTFGFELTVIEERSEPKWI